MEGSGSKAGQTLRLASTETGPHAEHGNNPTNHFCCVLFELSFPEPIDVYSPHAATKETQRQKKVRRSVLFFRDKVSQHSPGCPGIKYVDQSGLSETLSLCWH